MISHPDFFKSKVKTFKELLCLMLIFLLSTFCLLFAAMIMAKSTMPSMDKDAVIILGAGLRGFDVSPILQFRLDKAIEYIEENPDSIIIVSGGQGPDELISEALAMKQYLVGRGIEENKIFMEDKSRNTKENFFYSKILLDEYFNHDNYKVVFVTSDFHVLRSGYYAKKVGFDFESLSSPSIPKMLPAYYLREYAALMQYYIAEAWR